jgi:tetratricopeptide (TPR) repeat protein
MKRFLEWLGATFGARQRLPTRREQWKVAADYLDQGSWQAAVEAFQEYVRLDPHLAGGHYNLGQAYFQLGLYEPARDAYLAAVRCDPTYAEAQAMLGMACTELGRYEEAIAASQKACSLKPDLPQAYNNLGIAFMGLECWEKALEPFETLLAIAPSDPMCHLNMASVYSHMGRYNEAIAVIEQCLRRVRPEVQVGSMLVGGLLSWSHAADLEDWALQWLSGAESPRSLDPEALGCFLQSLASRCGEPGELSRDERERLQQAVRILARYRPSGSFSAALRTAEKQLLKKLGRLPDNTSEDLPDREQEYDRLVALVVETNEHLLAARMDRARTAAQQNLAHWWQITRRFTDADDQDPRLDLLLVDLGICLRETKSIDAAEETFRRALRRLAQWSGGHSDEPVLQNAIATCHNQLGLLFLDTGRLASGEEAFRHALTIRQMLLKTNADNLDNAVCLGGTLCNLGHLYASRWQFSEALASYDRSIRTLNVVLRSDCEHTQAELFLSNAHTARADTIERIARIRKTCYRQRVFNWLPKRGLHRIERPDFGITTFVDRRPASPLPQTVDYGVPWPRDADTGPELLQAGRYQEVLQSLDRSIAKRPDYVDSWFWRAKVLGAMGRHADALESLGELLELQPDYTPARCDKSDILRFLGRDREAFAEIQSVLDHNGEYAHAWYLRGLILASPYFEGGKRRMFDLAQIDVAIEAFDQAILLDPDYFEARLYKGVTLSISCCCASARINLLVDRASRELGDEIAADYMKPDLKAFHGYLDRARESFHQAIQIRPEDSAPWYQKGKLLSGLGGFEYEAMDAFSRATQLQPDLADAWYEWASLLSEKGNRDEAKACVRKAIAADPRIGERAREDFPWFVEQSP